MSSSTLTPGNLPAGPDRRVHRGHGTAALGPSDSSDSGSDMVGLPGVPQQVDEALGDADFDSDTDRNGSGERASAENDGAEGDGSSDIRVDRIIPAANDEDEKEGL